MQRIIPVNAETNFGVLFQQNTPDNVGHTRAGDTGAKFNSIRNHKLKLHTHTATELDA